MARGRTRADADDVSGSRRQLALVLWNGNVGGAEVFSFALAERLGDWGSTVTLVFVEDPDAAVIRRMGAPAQYQSLGLRRGRDLLIHPRRYADLVGRWGRDGALLVDCGFMGAALRAGGYAGPIVGIEHGALIGARAASRLGRAAQRVGRLSGAWADDVEVAVSRFVLEDMEQHAHARSIRVIHNGVDPNLYVTPHPVLAGDGATCVAAFGGRLIPGKGVDHLLHAIAALTPGVRLLVAGEGSERLALERLAESLGVAAMVEFMGLVSDMPQFWRHADVAVLPSAEFIESCPMVVLEAMAAGLPVVATRNGGVGELVVDGESGILVRPRSPCALAEGLARYARDPALREMHGSAGRRRVAAEFHLDGCARRYLEIFDELTSQPRQ